MLDLLRLNPRQSAFVIKAAGRAEIRGRFDQLAIRTRTVIGILRFLAENVVVPKEHVQLGIVDPFPDDANHAVFRVLVSRRRPKEASLMVRYRGHWFYVPDADRSSKATFFVLAATLAYVSFSHEVAAMCLLFSAVGDPAAAVAGFRVRRRRVFGKSPVGTLAFAAAAAVAASLFAIHPEVSLAWWVVAVGVLVAAVVELLPIPPDDNLTVPLASGAVMALLVLL